MSPDNCTADLDHPCDGGEPDEHGDPQPCASCKEWIDYMYRVTLAEYRAGYGRRKEDTDQELRDAGRGHLVRP